MKKGQLVWENISKWILVLIFLIALLMIVFSNRELMSGLLEKVKLFLRFGG